MERKKTRLKLWPIALMPAVVWGNLLVPVARAQIAPDGSLPTEVMGDGNNFTIEGGQSAGSNLFHSFQEFSVPTGGRAYFNNGLDVENIFSRVTGGNISNIDGLIRANGSANLFLLNPAGIVFGPNASLNIGGSFLGSTASGLLFPNGQEFRAINQPEPLLTINAPIGLWFRGNEGNIVNRSAEPVRLNNRMELPIGLRVKPGQSLGLVGGNVRVNGGIIRAPGGRVDLGGLTAAGTVGLNNDGSLSFPEGVARGNVEFANFAIVNVRRDGGGTIAVHANDVNILRGTLLRSGIRPGLGTVDAGAGNITIDATGAIAIDGSAVANQVGVQAIGNAGNIEIEGRSLSLSNGAELDNSNLGQGNAGNVTINVDSLELTSGSGIFADVQPGSTGNGNELRIETDRLLVADGSQVSASTFGIGDAGNLNISATESVEVRGNGSGLFADVVFGTTVDGAIVPATGSGGDLTLSTGKLLVADGANVSARTFGEGNAGSLNISATESVEISGLGSGLFTDVSFGITPDGAITIGTGTGGNLQISTAQLIVEDGAIISTNTFGKGNAGNLTISNAELVELRGDDAVITANTFGEGNAGNLTISNAESVKLSGEGSGLFAQVLGETTVGEVTFAPAIGNGGELTIFTNRLIVQDGASISASTFGAGDAGNLTINARESVTVSSSNSGLFAQVNSQATGNGGLLQIITGELLVQDEASVSARAIGRGDANNLIIETDRLRVRTGGQISASTFGPGNAGNLTVNARELIELTGESAEGSTGIFSNAIEGTGDGGNLEIATPELIIQDGASIGVSNFQSQDLRPPGSGNPGNINIQAGSVLLNDGRITAEAVAGDRGNTANIRVNSRDSTRLQNGSEISASTRTGIGGNVIVKAGNSVIIKNSTVTVSSTDTGAAGNITVRAREMRFLGGTLRAETAAEQGNIDLKTSGNIELRNGSRIITDAREDATGGNIDIKTNFLIAYPGDNDITANADAGDGGKIEITAEAILGIAERDEPTGGNDITVSSTFGREGEVIFNIPDVEALQGRVEPSDNPVDAEEAIAQACQRNPDGEESSFTVVGRGGVPRGPQDPLTSDTMGVGGKLASQTETRPPIVTLVEDAEPISSEDIVLARGWIVHEDGVVELTAYPTPYTSDRPFPHPVRCPRQK
ncbi:MAG: filamentous hemagglutinin N-terminal domain-containing protein [Hormoscilla sp.]